MTATNISRRAALLAAATVTAWARSPAGAILRSVSTATPDAAIDLLLAQMTIEEKAGQLTLMAAAWGGSAATALNPAGASSNFDAQVAQAAAGRLTGVFNGAGAEAALRLQSAAVRRSRLGIPMLFAADVIHGHRTIFPVPLGEAASFDPALAERTARAAAVEAAASGIDWTFAPMVDIARDQRWGRGVESSGEDVFLGRLFAAARVKGFQGSSLKSSDAVLACAKHFAGYGAAEGGLDYNTVDVSERTLREVYFPPFQAAFDAGALSTMAAFNELSGVPATGNAWLLTDVLRKEWQFRGLVVSDYTGDEELIAHGFAEDAREATRLAFMAGVDVSMQSGFYMTHLPDLVAKGEVPMARLDEAVRRVLLVKTALGLFEDPFRRIDVKRERARSRMPVHLELAREAAQRSIVMLRNEGDLLPLPRAGKRIALIGPFAEGQHDLIGPWNVYGDDTKAIDIAPGLRKAMADPSLLTVTAGSGIEKPLAGGTDAAVRAASDADIVILAIGESQIMSGEAQSRTEIIVPAPQQALAEAVAKTGKPMVVLLKNGRGLALTGAVVDAPALLVTWFLGSETGHAIADVLFGRVGPSGRLPLSFPYNTGQQPFYYAHKATGRPNPVGSPKPYKTHYRTTDNAARFAFGHGLTYGTIEYGLPQAGAGQLAWTGTLELSVDVSNTGKRAADEVVQLYVHDRAASMTRPVRQLVGFRKVSVAPGQQQRVTFSIARADLEFIGLEMKRTVEPGMFDFWIAPSSASGTRGQFMLLADGA